MPIGTGYVGIAKESTFGTAVAPANFLPVKSAEANTDPQNYYPEEIRSSRAKNKVVPMGQKHEASTELDAEPNNLGHFLLAALGNVASVQPDDVGNPTVYDHVFTPGNVLPSYTLEMYDTLMIRRIAGSKLDTLSLAVEAGGDGVLTAEGSWFAQSIADEAAAASPSYNDQLPFSFNGVDVTKGGSATTEVRSMELEISNNLKDDHYVLSSSKNVSEIPEGMREVTGSVEMFFKSKADYTAFMAGTKDSLKFTFTGAIISGTYSEKLILDLPDISYDAFEVPLDGPDDEIVATMEFTALYDSNSAYEVQATLTNTITAY